MRIPIPERFQAKHVLLFTIVIFVAQQIEGTDLTFSVLCAAFVAISAQAFNVAGGFNYASGAWIFFNSVSTAILGICYKLFTAEPAQTHLINPNKTMLLYCCGMTMVGYSAYLSHQLRPRVGILSGTLPGRRMQQAAVGCLVMTVLVFFIAPPGSSKEGSIASAVGQLNRFPQMAIILATTYEITSSNGKRSINWVVWVAGSYLFLFGLLYFSKEGMFVAFVTWLIPTVALRYSFSWKQVLIGATVTWFCMTYLVPYSQYGRSGRDASGHASANLQAAIGFLSDLEGTRRAYLETEEAKDQSGLPHFYDQPAGLFDREQMLAFDDAMFDYTDSGNVFGLAPTFQSFSNIVPHFLWKNKPTFSTGNDYGRELGVISDEDTTTGISFSPLGDAYHQAKWLGVFVVLPIVTFLYFFITDSLVGSVRDSPWPLLPIAMVTHIAPQGLLQGTIYLMTYGTVAVLFIAVLARFVMPIFANVLLGQERTRVRRTIDFRAGTLRRPGAGLNGAPPPAPDTAG